MEINGPNTSRRSFWAIPFKEKKRKIVNRKVFILDVVLKSKIKPKIRMRIVVIKH